MNNYQTNILLKKNVILIPADYNGESSQKGVLSLEYKKDKILANIRCYNLKQTDEIFSVGIQVGETTFKTQVTTKQLANLKLQIDAKSNTSSKVSCVIVKVDKKTYSTLLWGSTEITKTMAESFFVEQLLEKTKIIIQQENENISQKQEQHETFTKAQSLAQQQEQIFEQEALESYIDKVITETSENDAKQNVNDTNSQQENDSQDTFFETVKQQVDNLLLANQPDEILQKIIPDSKFCRVQNGDEFYVFGVIYEQGAPKCICYGVPREYSTVPPVEVDGFCQWLPMDEHNYHGKGYWMTYQDAISGENIVVELIS